MPFFSVIIPCYNAQDTLEATLNSVKEQEFKDFEVIIMDDGSTDESASIAQAFVEADTRFVLIRSKNSGPSCIRNRAAFERASGEYLAFLDADDLWHREKLKFAVAHYSSVDAPHALYSQVGFFNQTISDCKTISKVLARPLTIRDLIKENPVCTMSNIIVRRDKFVASGGFKRTMSYAEDLEWLIRLVACNTTIKGMDRCLTFYRTSDAGLSTDFERMHDGWRLAVGSAHTSGANLSKFDLIFAEAVHLSYLARHALRRHTQKGVALKYMMRALAKCPLVLLQNPKRNFPTLIAALVEPLLTRNLSSQLFSR